MLNPNQVKQLDVLFTNYMEMLAHDPSIPRRFGAHLVITRWPKRDDIQSVNQSIADLRSLTMFSLTRPGDVLHEAIQVAFEAIADLMTIAHIQ